MNNAEEEKKREDNRKNKKRSGNIAYVRSISPVICQSKTQNYHVLSDLAHIYACIIRRYLPRAKVNEIQPPN
jgi:hypothetical protein